MGDIKKIREKAFALTEKIIQTTGPRLAGTKADEQAAMILKDEMDTFAHHTALESFALYKGAFLGWIRILVTCYLFGVVFLWLGWPYVAAALAAIGIVIMTLQFFLYKPLIDRFYPKRQGYNVIGTIEPKDVVKRQVVISGHHDSARIFNFLIHQPKLYDLRTTGSIALVAGLLVSSLLMVFIPSGLWATIVKIVLSLGFLLTGQMWFFASRKGTPGAGDNLIASTMALEIGRYFSENLLQNTRVIIASFDAEEEGLRGARAYAKTHGDDLHEVPTVLLNTDCPYELDELFFLTSDINCSVSLSQSLADELVEIAKQKNYPAVSKPIAFLTGGTDAGELAKIGIKATTLMAMPWSNSNRSNVYHTPKDTIDSIEKKAIDAAIDIFVTYIESNDKS